MKEITITIRARVTDDFYKSNVESVVNKIKSGQMQSELLDSNEGIKKVTATSQVINIKK